MNEIRVKFTYPTTWNVQFIRQTPKELGHWGNYIFLVNTEDEECDVWVVFENITTAETARCAPENVIFITGEPVTIKTYNKDFLSLFNYAITTNRELEHPNLIFSQTAIPWWVGLKYDAKAQRFADEYSKTYDELYQMEKVKKTKLISVICSDKTMTEGHQKRIRFVNALKEKFGDQMDVYGRGVNTFSDKWDVIAPYKYHIIMENSFIDDYFTEKLSDSYLAESFPFYYGCPNLEKYFNTDAFLRIDVDDVDGSIATIEQAITNNLYTKQYQAIKQAKDKVLNEYNIFPMIVRFIEDHSLLKNKRKKSITIDPLYQPAKKRKYQRILEKITLFGKR